MTEIFLIAASAIFLGLPSLVIGGLLALRRRTRYFAIPLVAGLIAGAVAGATSPYLPLGVFIAVFGIVAAPLTIICGIVAFIAAADPRWPKVVRNVFAIVLGVAALALVIDHLDRPGAEPTGRFTGQVQNLSSVVRDDGTLEARADVVLDDGRKVHAVSRRPFLPVSAPVFPPVFPERFELPRVRVDEYRSVISGRRSYTFVEQESAAPAGKD